MIVLNIYSKTDYTIKINKSHNKISLSNIRIRMSCQRNKVSQSLIPLKYETNDWRIQWWYFGSKSICNENKILNNFLIWKDRPVAS